MADYKSSEGKGALIYYCFPCDKEYVVDPSDPKKDGRTCNQCGKHLHFRGGVDFASGKDYSALSIKVDVDVSDAIKGLKAVQREAKKATAALKELSEVTPDSLEGLAVSELIQATNGYKPHTVVFDEMHSMCPRCGSTNRNREDLTNGNEKVYAVRITCSDCGYTL